MPSHWAIDCITTAFQPSCKWMNLHSYRVLFNISSAVGVEPAVETQHPALQAKVYSFDIGQFPYTRGNAKLMQEPSALLYIGAKDSCKPY